MIVNIALLTVTDTRTFDNDKSGAILVETNESKEAYNKKKKQVAILESGIMINSDFLNGLENEVAKKEVIKKLESQGIGSKKVNYKLRDWGISRQRYWEIGRAHV